MTRRSITATLAATTASLAVLASATSAQAKTCGDAGSRTTEDGLGAVQVKASGTSCKTARRVARKGRVGEEGEAVQTTIKGREWTCVVTRAATGTDPGFIPRSKVRCTSADAVVRFKLQS